MKIKLFGNNIDCSCDYCDNYLSLNNGEFRCKKNRRIDDFGKCIFFSYDPLKREPRPKPKPRDYNPEDFML